MGQIGASDTQTVLKLQAGGEGFRHQGLGVNYQAEGEDDDSEEEVNQVEMGHQEYYIFPKVEEVTKSLAIKSNFQMKK